MTEAKPLSRKDRIIAELTASNTTLRAELAKANASWAAADNRQKRAEADRDRLQESWDKVRRELADERAHLSRVRTAEAELHRALYPEAAKRKLTFGDVPVTTLPVPPQGIFTTTYNGDGAGEMQTPFGAAQQIARGR